MSDVLAHPPSGGRPAPPSGGPPAPSTRWPGPVGAPHWPVGLEIGLISATALLTLLVVLDTGGALRALLTLGVLLVLPGATMLVRTGPRGWATRFGLAIPLSLASSAMVAMGMAWSGLWFPRAAFVVVALVCCGVLGADVWLRSGRYARRSRGAGGTRDETRDEIPPAPGAAPDAAETRP